MLEKTKIYCTRTSKRIIQSSKIYYKELRVQDSNSPTRCSSDGAHRSEMAALLTLFPRTATRTCAQCQATAQHRVAIVASTKEFSNGKY